MLNKSVLRGRIFHSLFLIFISILYIISCSKWRGAQFYQIGQIDLKPALDLAMAEPYRSILSMKKDSMGFFLCVKKI